MKKSKSTPITRAKHQIDAAGKIAGRLASGVATILLGKNKPNYKPNLDSGDFVEISNVKQLCFSGKKIGQKNYFYPSGYPGGMRKVGLAKFMKENPEGLFKQMVKKMLPNNSLRDGRLKRLTFEK